MKETPDHHLRDTKSKLGQAYWQHHDRVMAKRQSEFMGHMNTVVLDGIESYADEHPKSNVAQIHQEMIRAIGPNVPAGDPEAVAQFSDLYKKASDLVFPATEAFLTVRKNLDELFSSYSAAPIDLDTLRVVDMEAHSDATLDELRNNLKSRLNRASRTRDVTANSQAFETYGEIIAYRFLRKRVHTCSVPVQQEVKTPDFVCTLSNEKRFWVEVKTLDIAGGEFRHREIVEEGSIAQANLKERTSAGDQFASAAVSIEPFRKLDEGATYDPWSLIRVIGTLREKSRQAFKKGQFTHEPTFALAITDRLTLPGGKFDLLPYYQGGLRDDGISSGVLWHMAYGRPGTSIFRPPEIEGAEALDGHLDEWGLFVDEANRFPGPGLIVLNRREGKHFAYGLLRPDSKEDSVDAIKTNSDDIDDTLWTVEDTHCVLDLLCDFWNDMDARNSWRIYADNGTQCRK